MRPSHRFTIPIAIILLALFTKAIIAKGGPFPQLLGHKRTFAFDVYAPTQKDADEVSAGLEAYYRRFLADLKHGGMLKKRPEVYIFTDYKEYLDNLAPLGYNVTHTGAIAVPRSARKAAKIYGFLSQDLVTRKLPHELTHLLFREFTAGLDVNADIPLWLNEGMASYEEMGDYYARYVQNAREQGTLTPLAEIVAYKEYPEDQGENALFYAQSASMVEFLITTYGGQKFLSFSSKIIRGKKRLEEALSTSFYPHIRTVDQFSAAWLNFLRNDQ